MALGDSGLYMKLHIIKLSIGVILLAAVALTFHDIYVIAFVNGAYTVFSIICIDAKPAKRKIGVGILEQLRLTLPTLDVYQRQDIQSRSAVSCRRKLRCGGINGLC